MNTLNIVHRPVEDLTLVNGFLRLDADHVLDTKTRMNQPEVLQKGPSEADVLMPFNFETYRDTGKERQKQFSIDGFVLSESVWNGGSTGHESLPGIPDLSEDRLKAFITNNSRFLIESIKQCLRYELEFFDWSREDHFP